ncbi:hypothetical protein RND81_01G068300 [Saponaria officinalis]|uniref:J domain-containing protein n=1 Tax=Saponaria officinalis TaxID=3572 RepID=A0AAW1NH04_SAPOF
MADREDCNDFYGVLGLKKDCTKNDLKNAYKKLAMKWHPDRCTSSGNSKFVEEANKKFQAIQSAYSVLSDETKRFLYDVGVYDTDDDHNNHGMGEFLDEMATMMCENKPSENGEESFEQLQELFDEMFQGDAFSTTSHGATSCSSTFFGSVESSCHNNKRSCSEMNYADGSSPFSTRFCVGAEYRGEPREGRGVRVNIGAEVGGGSSRRQGRKQKVSFAHDVSSNDFTGIST